MPLDADQDLESPIHLPPRWSRRLLRLGAGLGLVLHGLGHAVLPFRGMGGLEASEAERSAALLLAALPLVAFVAAGLGVLGARWLARAWLPLLLVAAPLSLVAIVLGPADGLWPGLLLSGTALVLGGLVARGVLPQGGPAVRVPIGRWQRLRSQLGAALAMGLVLYVAVAALARPLHHSWGSTEVELAQALPGDWPGRHPAFEVNHAITIAAPPERVWPWLIQIGQDRGGFYSYDWLENLFGANIHNAEQIVPVFQQRRVGDLVRAVPPDWMGGRFGSEIGWRVRAIEPERLLLLEGWGAFVLRPLPGGRTRLYIRSKIADPRAPVWASALSLISFELPHFIMERKMLLTLRQRAEASPSRPLAGTW